MENLIIDNKFISSQRSRGQEDLVLILGKDPTYWVEKAIKEVSDEGLKSPNEDHVLMISSAACGIEKNFLKAFILSSSLAIFDRNGYLAAFKIPNNLLEGLKYECWEDITESLKQTLSNGSDVSNVGKFIMDQPSLNSFKDLAEIKKRLMTVINQHWMEKSVRIDRPDLAEIGPEVEIGPGSWISGHAKITGKTKIGSLCKIEGISEINDSQIGDGVRIWNSVIEESVMEDGSNIGPFSHLRPKAHLGKKVHVGNFVELKKASMDEGSKAGHLAYIGDAKVGKHVNISCGVIFCNYDGKNKHVSTIGDGVFLGSNANIVAPVDIEDEAFIAAGSTITKDVENGALAVERAKQVNLPGYVEKKKAEGKL